MSSASQHSVIFASSLEKKYSQPTPIEAAKTEDFLPRPLSPLGLSKKNKTSQEIPKSPPTDDKSVIQKRTGPYFYDEVTTVRWPPLTENRAIKSFSSKELIHSERNEIRRRRPRPSIRRRPHIVYLEGSDLTRNDLPFQFERQESISGDTGENQVYRKINYHRFHPYFHREEGSIKPSHHAEGLKHHIGIMDRMKVLHQMALLNRDRVEENNYGGNRGEINNQENTVNSHPSLSFGGGNFGEKLPHLRRPPFRIPGFKKRPSGPHGSQLSAPPCEQDHSQQSPHGHEADPHYENKPPSSNGHEPPPPPPGHESPPPGYENPPTGYENSPPNRKYDNQAPQFSVGYGNPPPPEYKPEPPCDHDDSNLGYGPPPNGSLEKPPPSGGYQRPPSHEYQRPPSKGPGHERPPLSDGYQRPPPSDRYQRPPPSNGYQRPPPSDGYQRPPPSDGYQRPGPSDGYQRPPPSDGYQRPPPSDGYGKPPSDGYGKAPPNDGNGKPPPNDGNGKPPPSDGYGKPPPSDAYQRPPSSEGYQRPPSSDGYPRPPPDSGYERPPPNNGYESPPTSSGLEKPPPSSGYEKLSSAASPPCDDPDHHHTEQNERPSGGIRRPLPWTPRPPPGNRRVWIPPRQTVVTTSTPRYRNLKINRGRTNYYNSQEVRGNQRNRYDSNQFYSRPTEDANTADKDCDHKHEEHSNNANGGYQRPPPNNKNLQSNNGGYHRPPPENQNSQSNSGGYQRPPPDNQNSESNNNQPSQNEPQKEDCNNNQTESQATTTTESNPATEAQSTTTATTTPSIIETPKPTENLDPDCNKTEANAERLKDILTYQRLIELLIGRLDAVLNDKESSKMTPSQFPLVIEEEPKNTDNTRILPKPLPPFSRVIGSQRNLPTDARTAKKLNNYGEKLDTTDPPCEDEIRTNSFSRFPHRDSYTRFPPRRPFSKVALNSLREARNRNPSEEEKSQSLNSEVISEGFPRFRSTTVGPHEEETDESEGLTIVSSSFSISKSVNENSVESKEEEDNNNELTTDMPDEKNNLGNERTGRKFPSSDIKKSELPILRVEGKTFHPDKQDRSKTLLRVAPVYVPKKDAH